MFRTRFARTFNRGAALSIAATFLTLFPPKR